MKPYRRMVLGIACLLGGLDLPVTTALAQSSAPAATPPVAGSEAGIVALVIVGSLIVLGIAVKLYDVKRMRENEAAGLQGRITDVLLADRLLSGLTLTPLVRMPHRRGGLVTVSVSGTVTSPDLRDAVLALVMKTMEASQTSFRIEDRIAVDPLMDRRAA